MATLKKVLIAPYFGEFPPWFDLFLADFIRTMRPQGYELLLDTDMQSFKDRVKEKLGIDYPGVRGTGKVWDYRCALGHLYRDEIKGFDYWGHCDFDMVFGNVNKFLPDSKLVELDVYSSHHDYVCGCFSLYRNAANVRSLFYQYTEWQQKMIQAEPTGWVEEGFSRTLEQSGLHFKYEFNQGNPWTKSPLLNKKGINLSQFIEGGGWKDIMLFHFRHSKRWPL